MLTTGLFGDFSYVTIQLSLVFCILSGGKNRQHCEQNRQLIKEMLERKTGECVSRLGSGLPAALYIAAKYANQAYPHLLCEGVWLHQWHITAKVTYGHDVTGK